MLKNNNSVVAMSFKNYYLYFLPIKINYTIKYYYNIFSQKKINFKCPLTIKVDVKLRHSYTFIMLTFILKQL